MTLTLAYLLLNTYTHDILAAHAYTNAHTHHNRQYKQEGTNEQKRERLSNMNEWNNGPTLCFLYILFYQRIHRRTFRFGSLNISIILAVVVSLNWRLLLNLSLHMPEFNLLLCTTHIYTKYTVNCSRAVFLFYCHLLTPIVKWYGAVLCVFVNRRLCNQLIMHGIELGSRHIPIGGCS